MAGMDVRRHEPGRAIISSVTDIDTLDLSDYLEDKPEGENVRPASYFRDQTIALFHGGAATNGATLPWSKTHENIRLRAGEVTLWHGQNFSGKSMLTGQVALDLAWQGYRVCIASFEMACARTLQRMARQAFGTNQPDEGALHHFHDWTDDRVWLYDRRGQVDWPKVAAVIRYAVDKHDIQHFFIDSLMKCVRGEDDYNGQKEFINTLCTIANDLQIHVHIIHHTAKPKDANGIPGRYDAKGSGSISDQVDNTAGIWRNRDENKAADAPDCIINWDKQRGGEWDGKIALWFDPASFQYRGDPLGVRARQYIKPVRAAA